MKKVLLGFIVFFASLGVQAQAINNVPEPQKVEKVKVPKFKFNKEVHDFGKIPEGPAVSYTFEFKNTGKAPLLIQNASASCGCTSPEWPKEPILPGKKGKIKVTYNTAGRGGQPFSKEVYITSNVPTENNAPMQLHIIGVVDPPKSTPVDNKIRK